MQGFKTKLADVSIDSVYADLDDTKTNLVSPSLLISHVRVNGAFCARSSLLASMYGMCAHVTSTLGHTLCQRKKRVKAPRARTQG